MNPGLIFRKTSNESDEEISCILYFDSLKHTQKDLDKHGRNIRSWLAREYQLSKNADTTSEIDEETLKVYDPQGTFNHIYIYYIVPDVNKHIFIIYCTIISF